MANSVRGVILASGLSQRFGRANKLLASVGGKPVVRWTTEAYLGALSDVLVVVGHQAELVCTAIGDLPVQIVMNPDYQSGQSAALRHGLAALPVDTEAAIVGVADQPLLTDTVLLQLITRWRQTSALVIAPLYGGQRGNPVLFAQSVFPELLSVQGDVGGRAVLAHHSVEWVPIEPWWVGLDIDTPTDLDRIEAIFKKEEVHGTRHNSYR
jgi:molybdenum cofactor cytidylyltransferase